MAIFHSLLPVALVASLVACNGTPRKGPEERIIIVKVVDKARNRPVPDADVWLEVFRPGRAFSLGSYQIVSRTKADLDGKARIITSESSQLQVGAAACDDFMAQGMTVVPDDADMSIEVEVVLDLKACRDG
jgi:hypothetical protein